MTDIPPGAKLVLRRPKPDVIYRCPSILHGNVICELPLVKATSDGLILNTQNAKFLPGEGSTLVLHGRCPRCDKPFEYRGFGGDLQKISSSGQAELETAAPIDK